MDYIEGVDVSHWQGADIDWSLVEQAGYQFAIPKATEGRKYRDPRWLSNAKAIQQDTSLYWTGYHFARPSSDGGGRPDGEAEARDFVQALKDAGAETSTRMLPPALDWEEYPDRSAQSNIDWIEGFVHVVESELGRSPMIYTGQNVWKYTLGNTSKFVHLPLWQVSYTAGSTPATGLPWPQWTVWQWSGGGSSNHANNTVPGIAATDVDRNRMYPGEHMLEALARPTIWTPASPWDPTKVAPPEPEPKPDCLGMPYEELALRICEIENIIHNASEKLHELSLDLFTLYEGKKKLR